MNRRHLFGIIVGILFFAPFAQTSAQNVDLTRLTDAYEAYIRYVATPEEGQTEARTTVLEERVEKERSAARSIIEAELLAIVATDDDEEVLDPERSLARQRSLIVSLEDKLKERKADLALLQKEEKTVLENYENTSEEERAATAASYAHLLARKATLEDRIDLMDQILTTQKDREQQLRIGQRWNNLGTLGRILFYIAIFFGVLWIERLIRSQVFILIKNRKIRFSLTKLFTPLVYLCLLFWFIQEIVTQYPTVLTAFAFIAAATVLATQDFLKSFLGWLTQSQNLSVGSRVTVYTSAGAVTGDIVDVGILATTLLVTRSPDMSVVAQVGKMVRIPNIHLLTQPVVLYNSTSDYIRSEMIVRVPKVEQYEQAKQIFEDVLRDTVEEYQKETRKQMERRSRALFHPPEITSSCVFMELEKDAVVFTLCFSVPLTKRRTIVTEVTEEILKRCIAADITLITKNVTGTK